MKCGAIRVGLVVEGDTEFYALPKLAGIVAGCPPLRAINLRGIGSHLTPEGVARMALSSVKQHIAAKRERVIVCLDREDRTEVPETLENRILAELRRLLRNPSADVRVVVANRTFEAWILADALNLFSSRHFVTRPHFFCFEGQMGKRRKKGIVELSTLLGREYRKTRDGHRLFSLLNFEEARTWGTGRRGSKSLDALLRGIGI